MNEALRFSPNPVSIGSDVTLDVGSEGILSRLRITDSSGRLVHDVNLETATTPYVMNTSGMKSGTYIIEAWVLNVPQPSRGKLSVIGR